MAELTCAPPVEWRPSKSQRRAWRRLRLATCRQVEADVGWLLNPLPHIWQWLHAPACDESGQWQREARQCEKWEANIEPNTISYCAGIRACDQGEAKMEPDFVASHKTGNSACEKWEANIEPDTIGYSAGTRAREKEKANLKPDIARLPPHSTLSEKCEKGEANLEPDVNRYSAGIRACERRKAKLEPDVASHSTGNRACEKWEANTELDTISYSAGIRACEKGEAKLEPVIAVTSFFPSSPLVATAGPDKTKCGSFADAKFEPNVTSYSAGNERREKPMCGKREAKSEPDIISSYSTGTSACEKGKAKQEPDIASYSAGSSACEKGDPGQKPLTTRSGRCEAKMEPVIINSYSAGIRACEKGKAKLEPDGCGIEEWRLQLEIKRIREAKAAQAAARAAQEAAAAAVAAHGRGGSFPAGRFGAFPRECTMEELCRNMAGPPCTGETPTQQEINVGELFRDFAATTAEMASSAPPAPTAEEHVGADCKQM